MESLDLDINNYDYDDLLNLFQIDIEFGENELRQAKKQVLLMHPDKSNLDKKYFLFFSAAYKMIFSVYQFREKGRAAEKLNPNNENIEYLAEKDTYNQEIIDSLMSSKNFQPTEFNKWFNELFEKVKLDNEYDNGGYGDWLKVNEEHDTNKCENLTEMNEAIDIKKNKLRSNAIIKHNNIDEFNSSSYCDLTNSRPDEYSSGMFSKLQYEDLKKAHEESVVPVTQADCKCSYSSIDDIRTKRSQQNLTPLNDKEANSYLNAIKYNDNFISSQRAFKLAKEEEHAREANKTWWSSLKQIK